MRSASEFVDYLNLALFTLVAVLAARQWWAGRGRAGLWAALAFGSLAVVADVGRLLPDEPTNDLEFVLNRALICVLVVFPYLLYRFTAAFRPPPRGLERLTGVMTVGLLVWTALLPTFPAEGEPRPPWFLAYLAAFLFHWTLLTVVVAVRLWRAGRGQPNAARRRMQMLSVAATAITVALFLAAGAPDEESALALTVGLLATVSAIAFLVGLAPPAALRLVWRRPEQAKMQAAIADLFAATSEEDVATRVAEPVARMVGARAVAVETADRRVLATYRNPEASAPDERNTDETLRLDIQSGSLVVWPSPYAPFFGGEELRLLQSLGALTGLALDRARLFAHEREARLALERADELKSQFIALAAHELRTPAATVHGIVETLHTRAASLSPEQRQKLEAALRQQSECLSLLVDQLLDLSRLDAEAVAIEPRRFAVRPHVEELVETAAGPRADEVEITVEPDLEAVADTTAFDRIVSNLVVNAFRYGEPPVIVSAEQRDRHFRFAVEDRGRGVSPEFVPQLFERFTRSDHSTKDTGGTGLGLAIARSYARAHGGDVIYEQAQPHGARFEVVLPSAPPAAG